jgi:hypothetical protein
LARCICGHLEEDHSPNGPCLIDECECAQFTDEDLEDLEAV